MNNIAEGTERASDKELKHFLHIAKGSCGEVRSMLFLAINQGYVTSEHHEELFAIAEETSKMLSGFIKKL